MNCLAYVCVSVWDLMRSKTDCAHAHEGEWVQHARVDGGVNTKLTVTLIEGVNSYARRRLADGGNR